MGVISLWTVVVLTSSLCEHCPEVQLVAKALFWGPFWVRLFWGPVWVSLSWCPDGFSGEGIVLTQGSNLWVIIDLAPRCRDIGQSLSWGADGCSGTGISRVSVWVSLSWDPDGCSGTSSIFLRFRWDVVEQVWF